MLLSIGLLLSIIGCFVFGCLWFDRSISLKYLSASHESTVSAFYKVCSLLQSDWKGLSTNEVLEKLELEIKYMGNKDIVIDTNSEPGVIWFDEIRFEFESGKLKKISM